MEYVMYLDRVRECRFVCVRGCVYVCLCAWVCVYVPCLDYLPLFSKITT